MLYPDDSEYWSDIFHDYQTDTEEERTAQPDFHIRNILPASLESLHLWGNFTTEERNHVDQQLSELGHYLPSLKDVLIDTGRTGEMWEISLIDLLEGHGS